jgi:CBS domain-containing protein
MTCNEVMTPAPVTCRPGDAIVDAARLMRSYDVGSLPVVKDDESQMLVGVITDRDIAIRVVGEGRNPVHAKVSDAMSTEVVSCTTTDLYQEALQTMGAHQLRRMPVVDAQRRVVGIIAQADVATRIAQPTTTGALVEAISKNDDVAPL